MNEHIQFWSDASGAILLSLLAERSLSVIFESYWYNQYVSKWHIKELIATAVAFVYCNLYNVDVLASYYQRPVSFLGFLLTSLAIAGGSKAFVAMFTGLLGVGNK